MIKPLLPTSSEVTYLHSISGSSFILLTGKSEIIHSGFFSLNWTICPLFPFYCQQISPVERSCLNLCNLTVWEKKKKKLFLSTGNIKGNKHRDTKEWRPKFYFLQNYPMDSSYICNLNLYEITLKRPRSYPKDCEPGAASESSHSPL